MNKKVRVILFSTVSVLFLAICSHRVVKTYNEISPSEGIFEGFLLATIAGYHAVLVRNLHQQPEEVENQ